MSPAERERFLSNVLADVERIETLLERLRELARADNPELGGVCALGAVISTMRQRFPGVALLLSAPAELRLPMSLQNADIVFTHLIDNARRHGASEVVVSTVDGPGLILRVADDGTGVSPGNRARVFDPFFTTRRAEGGTGMGLGIVRALVRAHGGEIALEESVAGAAFRLNLPAA